MKLSVICPTYNSEKLIRAALQAWTAQSIPISEYEIIIVDRNSDDKTQQIVKDFSEGHENVKLLISPPRTSTQRNNGIKSAKSDVVVFFDDDSVPEKDHFEKGLKFLNDNHSIDILGGPQVDSAHDNFFAKSAGAAMGSFFGSFTMAQRYKKTKTTLDADEFSLTSANVFVRKKVFDKIGGFDESIYPGEDPELFARAKKNGVKMAFSPDIAVQHSRRPNLKLFCKQHYKYGYNRVLKEILSKTPFPQNLLFFTPSVFLIYILLLPVLATLSFKFLIPIALYGFFSLAFAVPAGIEKKLPLAIPLISFLFFAMHISYGAGFLYALLKK